MKERRLLNALGKVDKEYIEEASLVQQTKRPNWLKWGAIAACLCLLVVGGINMAGLVSWRSGCSGQMEHSITITNGDMYFSRNDDGIYLYHESSNTKEKIANFDGTLTQTASGVFLLNNKDGTIYKVTGNTILKIGSIETNCALIDVVSDKVYYQLNNQKNNYQIIEADLKTGENQKILVATASHIETQKILAGKLYYYIAGHNDDAIIMLDLASGEQKEIYKFSIGENNTNNHVVFYEDIIIIYSNQGLYSMEYNDDEVDFLTEYVPTTAALDHSEDQLYFIIAIAVGDEEYREALVSFNLQSKEMKELTQLTDGGMTQTYTEIAISKNGYYYTNPAAMGGLYYHSFDGSDEIQIVTNK